MDWEFTDIHAHIIPEVDDGSPDMETSLRMLEQAYGEGIRRIIATPHFGVINPMYSRERVLEKFEALAAELAKLHPDMELFMGNELFLAPGYPDGLEQGMSQPLADSRYVLVEFPMDIDYEFVHHEFRRLMIASYYPIFAHAERYSHTYKNVKALAELVNMGVLIQVNSHSVLDRPSGTSFFGKLFGGASEPERRSKLTQELIGQGLVHFIATDCHDMPGRSPMMKAAAAKVIELVGEEQAREIFLENPRLILSE